MACEKYSGWMTEAALGALAAERDSELRAHVVECESCRSAQEAASALVSAMDAAAARLVAGEPSPQFAARLRARIAEEPSPRAWTLLTWPRMTAVAGVVAVLVAVLMIRSPERVSRRATTATETAASAGAPGAQTRPSAGVAHGTWRIAERSTVPPPPRTSAAPSLVFEVLVPRGQMAEALELSAAVGDGRIDGAQLSALAQESAKPLELKAIQIAPMDTTAAEQSEAPAHREGAARR